MDTGTVTADVSVFQNGCELVCPGQEAFLAEAQHLSSTGSFSWSVATDQITWSDEVYRIFEFDRGVPVTPELIDIQARVALYERRQPYQSRRH